MDWNVQNVSPNPAGGCWMRQLLLTMHDHGIAINVYAYTLVLEQCASTAAPTHPVLCRAMLCWTSWEL
jgi:hypothetical protein